MRLRQVALVANELEPVVEDLCAVLGVEVAFRDPGVGVFGLHNAVMPLGDTFLEVVSPAREGTSAGRLLARRGGDGGYMAIFQTGDLDAERRRMQALGVRVVWEASLDDAATLHLHPRDVGGAIVSLDAMDPPESWRWAGPGWREAVHGDVTAAIAGVTLQADDPAALAARWAQVLDRKALPAGDGHAIALDDGGRVEFVAARDGRGEGLAGLDVVAVDRARLFDAARERGLPAADDHVLVCGTRIRPVEPR